MYVCVYMDGWMYMQDASKRDEAKAAIEQVAKDNNFEVKGWRTVPVKPSVLGPLALAVSSDHQSSAWLMPACLHACFFCVCI